MKFAQGLNFCRLICAALGEGVPFHIVASGSVGRDGTDVAFGVTSRNTVISKSRRLFPRKGRE